MAGPARRDPSRAQRWVFTMTAAFLYAAAVFRSLLAFEGRELAFVIALLAVWACLLVVEPPASRRWRPAFVVYLVLQAAVIAVLLGLSDGSDYFAILLSVPGMRAMQRWEARSGLALIVAFAALIGLGVVEEFGTAEAVALSAIYTAANLILASYAFTARRATEAREWNEALAADLREANQRLAESARQAELLAGARERQRLARDLHDSATQTLFSMTLAARSAVLMLERRPEALGAQLEQIEQLAASARAELDALGAELPAAALSDGELVAALRAHLAEREANDDLIVDLRVDGDGVLPPDVAEVVLRITQEALNNVVKHAGVREAQVRLRLRRPAAVEIEDHGRGFGAGDPRSGAPPGGSQDPASCERPGVGLSIMRERAAEIGWRLTVTSRAGAGTRVLAEEIELTAAAEAGEGGDDRG